MKKNISNNHGRGVWAWDIVKLITICSIVLFLTIFYTKGFNEESNRLAIRLTARISGILFCLAFSASAFHAWFQNSFSWWFFMNRKFWGISFAIMHLVHLAFLVFLQQYFHPSWKILHTAGGYWIWLIFMISYVKRVLQGLNEYWPLVILFSITILLRIWKIWKK